MKKKELLKLVDQLMTDNQHMREMLDVLTESNRQLQLTIAQLLKKPDQLQSPSKHSGNSSLPPSTDIVPRTKSLRKPSGRKNGGQPGHEGSTLKITSEPDIIEDIHPQACTVCGASLTDMASQPAGSRHVIDIPPIRPVVTRYTIFKKVCACGSCTQSVFPQGVNAPVSYGSGVEALVVYLSVRQLIPYNRLAEVLKDTYGLSLSEGTIANILQNFKEKATGSYLQIKENLMSADVVGADETGGKVNGEKVWFHLWNDPQNTYIVCSDNRGSKTIEQEFPAGLPLAILVSDCWPAQLKTNAQGHQLCLAHLQRELNYFQEAYSCKWAKKLSSLFAEAISMHHQGQQDKGQVLKLKQGLDNLLAEKLPAPADKVAAFQKRLVKNRDAVFRFLDHPDVPPTNNASERAIRNITIKRKISGQFKSEWGADAYAIIRSVIDTAIKRNLNVMQQIINIANNACAYST